MGYDIKVGNLAPFDPSVHGTNKKLKIYYDETNNIRKLLLTENGFNVSKYDNFVLGGVVVDADKDVGDLVDLRRILKIQKNAPEIKFDMIAKGDFESALDYRKLGQYFSWLLENDIKIHYTNMNILNWSVLDIVESIVAEESFKQYFPIHRELKNELYRMVTCDVPAFLSILKSYSYPNIDRSETQNFLKEVRDFVLKHLPLQPNRALVILKEVLLKAQHLTELAFLVDETPDYVIKGFEDIFLNRVARFKNSVHVFDEEETVQEAIEGIRIMDGSRVVDFSFKDSKLVPGIQLADMMVGFLGKYFTFIERTPAHVLVQKKNKLNALQKENLKLFRQLVEKSDAFSNALLFRITTIDSDFKADYFLFGHELPPHLKAT
ncbi:DUF3800 domain-containing protein [Pseudomonas syringae]|uniref:DUF3800 domain-containing protein n=1 Tax=Pseudomonas syringae TaxID=317 RepID=UPI003F74DAEA